MDLKDLRDNLIPQGIHELRAGLNPKDLYLVQPRRWTQWLLRAIFGVVLVLGLPFVAYDLYLLLH